MCDGIFIDSIITNFLLILILGHAVYGRATRRHCRPTLLVSKMTTDNVGRQWRVLWVALPAVCRFV